VIQTELGESNGALSADDRWLAYEARQAARSHVFVRPYPNVDAGIWQVSPDDGGRQPAWSPDGRELFYVSTDGRLMGTSVDTANGFALGTPRPVLTGTGYYFGGVNTPRAWDVAPDGKRFLMIKDATSGRSAGPHAIVVLNWAEELKRRAPAR
jgi:Tol biopolymer transport system component